MLNHCWLRFLIHDCQNNDPDCNQNDLNQSVEPFERCDIVKDMTHDAIGEGDCTVADKVIVKA